MPMPGADRVLLVVRGLDPVGTGRLVELAAAGLAAAGHAVTVALTTTGGSIAGRLAGRGVEVEQLGGRPVGDLAVTLRLAGFARRLRPAAILGFGRSQIGRVAITRQLVPRCRGLVWLGLPPRGMPHAAALRWLDAVLAASPEVAAACHRAGVPKSRIGVVPPGLTVAVGGQLSREAVAASLGLDPARQWTLAVAPLEPAARLSRLLWAIDQTGVVRKDLQHVLVGTGPLLWQVQRRARAQELAERLLIVPDCELLPDLLRHTRLVWQSGEVALGGAILDGMACGLPAVAATSDAAGQLIVDGETGRLVPPVPESELPRRAFGILEDEALARRYGEAAARRAAEDFPPERFVAGLLAAVRGP
jgi:glycosyltransferase involved in cell wall biosynthesis